MTKYQFFYTFVVYTWFSIFSRHYVTIIMHYYIHIPFCNQKCPYCKFALTPIFVESKKRRYIAYLKNEIKEYFGWKKVNWDNKTIYFGGGTPSILSHTEILEILECFPFYGIKNIEITLESNPEDITPDYIDWLLALWINRLSIGVQTLNELSLSEIHRSNKNSILDALQWAYSSILTHQSISEIDVDTRFSINIDLIIGLPYTQPWEILSAIRDMHRDFPIITHTSVYMLEDESYPKDWKSNSISESELQSEFTEIIDYFDSIWWNHYELSNFAKPWYESMHNRGYWNHSNSRGFGLSSASYEDSKRWNNSSSFSGYYLWKKENEESLSEEQIQIEKMMFRLRTNGWEIDPELVKRETIQTLQGKWLIEVKENIIKVTKTWIFIIDHIMSELIS